MVYLSPRLHDGMLRGHRILIVEDEGLVAMLLEDALTEAGATVAVAGSVPEALRTIDAAAAGLGISAVVLDLNLDGENALPVADALTQRGIPFLISTGYGDHCDLGPHQAVPLLQKPYDPQVLTAGLISLMATR